MRKYFLYWGNTYGVEKSKIRKSPYCRGFYVDSIESTKRYLGKTNNGCHNIKKIKFLQSIFYTGKKFTDFGTLIQKKSHLQLSQFQIVSKYYLVLGFIFLEIILRYFDWSTRWHFSRKCHSSGQGMLYCNYRFYRVKISFFLWKIYTSNTVRPFFVDFLKTLFLFWCGAIFPMFLTKKCTEKSWSHTCAPLLTF